MISAWGKPVPETPPLGTCIRTLQKGFGDASFNSNTLIITNEQGPAYSTASKLAAVFPELCSQIETFIFKFLGVNYEENINLN